MRRFKRLTALSKPLTKYRALDEITMQLLAIAQKLWRIRELARRLNQENIVLLFRIRERGFYQ